MLPRGLYEALPWLYMAIGAMTTALLESEIKYLPALLFFSAGTLVLMYRHVGRDTRPRHRR
jgi:hypothetical protein